MFDYRPGKAAKIGSFLSLVLFAVFGYLVIDSKGYAAGGPGQRCAMWGMAVLIFSPGVYLWNWGMTRILMDESGVTLTGPLRTRRWAWAELKGVREIEGILQIVPHRGRGNGLAIDGDDRKRALEVARSRLRNLDAEERKLRRDERKALQAQPGASRDPRVGDRKIKRWITSLDILSVALFLAVVLPIDWIGDRAHVPSMAGLCLLTPLALSLLYRWPGRVFLDFERFKVRTAPRPTVVVPVMGPGLFLWLRSLHEHQLLSAGWMWLAALVASLLLFALVDHAVKGVRTFGGWHYLMLPFLTIHSWGTLHFANGILDSKVNETHVARVVKRDEKGDFWDRSRVVTLAPWGRFKEEQTWDVDWDDWQALEPGAEAQVTLAPGALGFPWVREIVRK